MKKSLSHSFVSTALCCGLMLGVAPDVCALPAAAATAIAAPASKSVVSGVEKISDTSFKVSWSDNTVMTVDFYGPNIIRLFQDPAGGEVRNPQATPPADILVKNPRKPAGELTVRNSDGKYEISSGKIMLVINNATGLMSVKDLERGVTVVEQVSPVNFGDGTTSVAFSEKPGEYFYGGGVQNGRFSHKGRAINIVNENSWTDGGVCSPAPYFWSTGGYGMMWHTFAPGEYDFGATTDNTVTLSHNTGYLDLFIMVSPTPVTLLNDYYQLTGNPVLLPKFGFYEGHLNAYNRDYWTQDTTATGGILFEDGKRYRESQKNNGGIRESLNGELPGNYQFSARAVVDRYDDADMPLGWVLPNDGYGAGYGQTGSLEGNVENLRQFGDYARSKGVEIGLWTQSDLHPKEGVEPLLQRDIVAEVRDAGVRVLKTDVAWVGHGYSFGLNGVADVAEIMPEYGNNARPFIISLDGWAGTQRYAGIWSGDQTGGEWEYIRFHIPTYIGSGLAGNPNITSDMDGIFGGRKPVINTRDFQWKTFSPMQLNMDGWGANPKYPQALGEPWTSINRNYLKLKSELMPYAYTYAREAVDGKPLIRAMFIDYPNEFTYTPATRYQYLYGPDFLIAPIYQATASDEQGNDIRNNIYLPEGNWIDYFTGALYEGNRVINSFDAPVWKLPVLVRQGAIIPMVNPNNNPSEINRAMRIYELYPAVGTSVMTEYDDDGITQQYLAGKSATTNLSMTLTPKGELTFDIAPTKGEFDGFVADKATTVVVNATAAPRSVEVKAGKKKVKLKKAATLAEFEQGTDMWYFNPSPELNRFSTPDTEFAALSMAKNPQIMVKVSEVNTTATPLAVKVKGYVYAPGSKLLAKHGALTAPAVGFAEGDVTAYTLTPSWQPVVNADYYEILFNDMLYSTIRDTKLLFEDLTPETPYSFKVRAVNADGASDWSDIEVTTAANPLEFAITGIRGRNSAADQPGCGVEHLFDFAEKGDIWHSRYQQAAVPCDVVIDLASVNTLDRFDYLPRLDSGNGTILAGTVAYSLDGHNWSQPQSFTWERSADVKQFAFPSQPQARFIKLHIDKGVGNYTSGRELYVFRVPGSESWIQGDINKDGRLDDNDFTSYMNYTGLRKGDADFDYVSIGDVNGNGLIDAYDISLVATELDGGVNYNDTTVMGSVAGNITVTAPRRAVNAGEEVIVTVKGSDLAFVNALSFALPYDANTWEYVTIEPVGMKDMVNLTYDRLHTSGDKVLYPTFVNCGTQAPLTGSETLMLIKFKAKKRATFTVDPQNGVIVSADLSSMTF